MSAKHAAPSVAHWSGMQALHCPVMNGHNVAPPPVPALAEAPPLEPPAEVPALGAPAAEFPPLAAPAPAVPAADAPAADAPAADAPATSCEAPSLASLLQAPVAAMPNPKTAEMPTDSARTMMNPSFERNSPTVGRLDASRQMWFEVSVESGQRADWHRLQCPRRPTLSGSRLYFVAAQPTVPSMNNPKDHDEDHDLDDEEDEEEEESPAPPPVKAKPKSVVSKSSAVSKTKARPITAAHLIAVGVAACLVGGAAGWLGHIQKGKADLRAAVAAAPAVSGAPAGPCGAWQASLCKSTGEQSAACQQAKTATEVLTSPVCESALSALPQTLTKIKTERVPCDKLVERLCGDLPPGSATCTMVKERTPSFPAERCVQMTQNYEKVIAELKQMDQQQNANGPGAPGGGMRPGMPNLPLRTQDTPPAGHP